ESRGKKERAGALIVKVYPALSSLKREADDEARSAVARLNIDASAVFLNNLFGDVEAQAGASFTFCGKEGIENPGNDSGRNSRTGIGYHNVGPRCAEVRRNR